MTQFKYEIPKAPTNKVQFAVDDSEFVELGKYTLGRGEVLEVKSAKRAAEIVRHPKFAYAPADAPVGPQKAGAGADVAPATVETLPLSMQIRESSRGRADLGIDAQRRLLDLEDAARSAELIGADAPEEIRVGAANLLAEITTEWQSLIATSEGTE